MPVPAGAGRGPARPNSCIPTGSTITASAPAVYAAITSRSVAWAHNTAIWVGPPCSTAQTRLAGRENVVVSTMTTPGNSVSTAFSTTSIEPDTFSTSKPSAAKTDRARGSSRSSTTMTCAMPPRLPVNALGQ